RLSAGDVLILEECVSPTTGLTADADPARRWAIRLVDVSPSHTDPLTDAAVVEVDWHSDDALPFPLCLSTVIRDASGERLLTHISVARVNVVLADHGGTIPEAEELPPVRERTAGRSRPRLRQRGITCATPYHHDLTRSQSAGAALIQDPHAALPAVRLL